jgi:thiosulfate reductase cytochrome b subunit
VLGATSTAPTTTVTSRHSALVRTTHWITALCFFALLISGGEIVLSHPRFYWGETGNNLTRPLFKLPVPASRRLVPTGYAYVLPDQNGWSRYLHFQAAWIVVIAGLLYLIWGLLTGHFRKNLLPRGADLSWRGFSSAIAKHFRFERPGEADAWSYNVVQRITYLLVIFILFPLIIWTGLAMSPAFVSEFPATSPVPSRLLKETK